MSETGVKQRAEKPREDLPDHICPPGVAKWLNSPVRTLFENPKRVLKGLVQEGDTVVDLGCGGGVFTAELAKRVGPEGAVYAIDVQQEMLELTRRYVEKRGLGDRVRLHRCGTHSLDLEDVETDLLIAVHMVHEAPDPEKLLEQATLLLKPQGRMLILEPKMHVSEELFRETVKHMNELGFTRQKPMGSLMGRGALFMRA